MRSAKRASATPMTWRRTRPGLAIGPSRLNTVGIPISRRDGAAKRNAGWNRGAKQKPMPASSTQRRTPSGVSSSTTPSASKTSAVPHSDDAPRAPCLHTGTPAPATTMAAIVDTLIECERSPPVPTMSTARRPQVVAQRHQLGGRQHRVEQPGQLVGGLALGPQGDDEADQLGRRGPVPEDRRHRRAGLVGA